MTDKLLLTVGEVAERLSVGKNRVYELMYSGQLFSVKLGGSRRIPAVSLEEFMEELTGSAGAA